jgi:hypothetical protein
VIDSQTIYYRFERPHYTISGVPFTLLADKTFITIYTILRQAETQGTENGNIKMHSLE